MKKFCSRDDILSALDAEIVEVKTPEWGGKGAVTGVKTFDGATRAKLLKPVKDGGMPADWMERIIIASACDESGKLLFSDDNMGALSTRSAVVLERLFVAAIELNGLSDKSDEAVKGESEPTPK